jgi:hypothetical protein
MRSGRYFSARVHPSHSGALLRTVDKKLAALAKRFNVAFLIASK